MALTQQQVRVLTRSSVYLRSSASAADAGADPSQPQWRGNSLLESSFHAKPVKAAAAQSATGGELLHPRSQRSEGGAVLRSAVS